MHASRGYACRSDLTHVAGGGMGAAFRTANPNEANWMAKPELGTKRVCVACSTRFYDLTKIPPVCPKCGTEQPVEQPRPRRTGGNVVEDRRPKKPVPAPGMEEADIEVEGVEEEGEEDIIEDAADLEDDADAIGPDIEVEPDSDETER
jgi:uncharacterized protein (TIGR02300 family)